MLISFYLGTFEYASTLSPFSRFEGNQPIWFYQMKECGKRVRGELNDGDYTTGRGKGPCLARFPAFVNLIQRQMFLFHEN